MSLRYIKKGVTSILIVWLCVTCIYCENTVEISTIEENKLNKLFSSDSIPFTGYKVDEYAKYKYAQSKITFDVFYRNHLNRDKKGYLTIGELLAAYMVADKKEVLRELYENPIDCPEFGISIRSKLANPTYYKSNYFEIEQSFKVLAEDSINIEVIIFKIHTEHITYRRYITAKRSNNSGFIRICTDINLNESELLPYFIDENSINILINGHEVPSEYQELYDITRLDSKETKNISFDFYKFSQIYEGKYGLKLRELSKRILGDIKPIDHDGYWTVKN